MTHRFVLLAFLRDREGTICRIFVGPLVGAPNNVRRGAACRALFPFGD